MGLLIQTCRGSGKEQGEMSTGLRTRHCQKWLWWLLALLPLLASWNGSSVPFIKLWEDGKNSTFRGSLRLLLLGISFPVRWKYAPEGKPTEKECQTPNYSQTLGARPQTAANVTCLLKTCQSPGRWQLGKRPAFVLERCLVPGASWCFTRGFLRLWASCAGGRGGVELLTWEAGVGCWCVARKLGCILPPGCHQLRPLLPEVWADLRAGCPKLRLSLRCHRGCQGLGAGSSQPFLWPGCRCCRVPSPGWCPSGGSPARPGCHPGSLPLPPAKPAAQGSQGIKRRIVLPQHLFPFHNLAIVRLLSLLNSRWTSKGEKFIKTGAKQKAFKARLGRTEARRGRKVHVRSRRPRRGCSHPSRSRTCCGSRWSTSLHPCGVPGAGPGRSSQPSPGRGHALFIRASGTRCSKYKYWMLLANEVLSNDSWEPLVFPRNRRSELK